MQNKRNKFIKIPTEHPFYSKINKTFYKQNDSGVNLGIKCSSFYYGSNVSILFLID